LVYVAVFLDSISGCSWVTKMASTSISELIAAVQCYQHLVITHARAFPDHVCSLSMLDASCPMPPGFPPIVSTCVDVGLGHPLVLRTRIREDRSCGNVLNPGELTARTLLYKANLYLALADLSVQLLYPMLLSANFARSVLPSMTPRPGPSPHQLWHLEMPTLNHVVTSPGALVSYFLTESLCPSRSVGIFVRPAKGAYQVYDIESRSLALVSEILLDVSAFCCAVTRSSPLTSELFGYAGLLTMAPLLGAPRLAGDGLGLFLDSWMLAHNTPPANAAAVDPLLMTYGGVGCQPRTCAAAALPGSACLPPRVVPVAIRAPYSDHAPLVPLPVALVLGAHQWDASAAWSGSCRGRFDTSESFPAAAVVDDGAETVN